MALIISDRDPPSIGEVHALHNGRLFNSVQNSRHHAGARNTVIPPAISAWHRKKRVATPNRHASKKKDGRCCKKSKPTSVNDC